ncbi:two-component system OmpR family response regulator [Hydrogenispora ethanolica]|uniref:Two-component system OmpR family response regulator n=1 Tax=Hydrogenispora ethanolica TaxID=1082276 RepID=A0A4V2QF04_HYDET|nr:response regulator transcription factor [Hydrogenispora ethanolica]TCL70097.1 two-component system OmpR family response regulator [Hydrogenispora ethanolica]
MAKRILIIDDEPLIVESVSYSLKQEGYEVIAAADGASGLQLAETEELDLILLDLMLPEMNGLEVCRTIRRSSDIPIIMLTAKEGEIDRVLGLELGADDYVTKPFSMRELIARIKSVLKRTAPAGAAAEGPKVLLSNDLQIDLLGHEVTVKGAVVNLSSKEYELLRILASHPGQVLTREQLLNLVWGNDFYGDDRTVDVHIRWLREKIEEDPGNPQYILTVRGVGYKFRK